MKLRHKDDLTLLNSPIFEEALPDSIAKAASLVENICNRVKLLDAHTALFFLSNHTSAPRLTYLLRTSPTFKCQSNLTYIDDQVMRTTIEVTNVEINEDSWSQASLPVRKGGLGLRNLASVALPCYISSLHKSSNLVEKITKQQITGKLPHLIMAETALRSKYGMSNSQEMPTGDQASKQRSWDDLVCNIEFNNLLNSANQVHSAHLLAAAAPHTGAWLQALPSPVLGLHLDDETIRVSVALRLGAQVCEPHKCRCGKLVNSLGHHGLSCRLSEGRLPRHNHLNDVIKRSLNTIGIPSWLEPLGLDRGDGKRPDGLTVFPFSKGKCLAWDATCTDTFAMSNINDCASTPGAAANKAEERKLRLYNGLQDRYRFEPIAIETTGVAGKSTAKLLSEIGRRITGCTGDKRETHWLRQRVSMAVFRGNASSVLATGCLSPPG